MKQDRRALGQSYWRKAASSKLGAGQVTEQQAEAIAAALPSNHRRLELDPKAWPGCGSTMSSSP